jgi:predicted ABC-type ATPase
MNQGSYRNIPPEIRAEANRRCEAFIEEHIRARRSFAVETTLRTEITFEQAQAARANGFESHMTYVATDDVEVNIERVAMRAERGGHSASVARIRETYDASLKHFPRALEVFDEVTAFDNTALAQNPRLVLVAEHSRITYLAENPPSWLKESLRQRVRDQPP